MTHTTLQGADYRARATWKGLVRAFLAAARAEMPTVQLAVYRGAAPYERPGPGRFVALRLRAPIGQGGICATEHFVRGRDWTAEDMAAAAVERIAKIRKCWPAGYGPTP